MPLSLSSSGPARPSANGRRSVAGHIARLRAEHGVVQIGYRSSLRSFADKLIREGSRHCALSGVIWPTTPTPAPAAGLVSACMYVDGHAAAHRLHSAHADARARVVRAPATAVRHPALRPSSRRRRSARGRCRCHATSVGNRSVAGRPLGLPALEGGHVQHRRIQFQCDWRSGRCRVRARWTTAPK